MTAIDGWTLNKKIDDNVKELREYIYYIGGKVYDLEEKIAKLEKQPEPKKKGSWLGKRKTSKGDA